MIAAAASYARMAGIVVLVMLGWALCLLRMQNTRLAHWVSRTGHRLVYGETPNG